MDNLLPLLSTGITVEIIAGLLLQQYPNLVIYTVNGILYALESLNELAERFQYETMELVRTTGQNWTVRQKMYTTNYFIYIRPADDEYYKEYTFYSIEAVNIVLKK